MKCGHCQATFEPSPNKKGFINECPECEGKWYRITETPSHEGAGKWDKAKMKKNKRKKPRPMYSHDKIAESFSGLKVTWTGACSQRPTTLQWRH
jgi:hypothetical protein